MADLGFAWQQWRILAFYLIVPTMLLLPARLNAGPKRTIPLNPVNPLTLGPIPNYTRPVRNATSPPSAARTLEELPQPTPCPSPTPPPNAWTFSLSGSYQFSNDRSRVGDVSLNSNSASIDLTATDNRWPWSCIDISYIYTHASGSSPSGTNETGNQSVGSLRVLQPLTFFGQRAPATLTTEPFNNQLGIILAADYGTSRFSTNIPQFPSIRSFTHTFVGNALLDYQFDWFQSRTHCQRDTYPGLLLELSSGIQFSTTRLHSADNIFAGTSSGQQLTYQNICCVTYSLSGGFGFLAAAEWDAPLHSDPLGGAQPFYANTAVFTGGLVYNIYAYRTSKAAWQQHWSASLLYSYTAFNPLIETNQLQIQLSYSF